EPRSHGPALRGGQTETRMTTTFHLPVLVWKDHEDYHTAALVEWDETPAVAQEPAEALEQLRDHVQWLYETQLWRPAPEFRHSRLSKVSVPVHPEYRADGRIYPCPEEFRLPVHVVSGHNDAGLLLAALPTLGIRFHFHDPSYLASLVVHYVAGKLQG